MKSGNAMAAASSALVLLAIRLYALGIPLLPAGTCLAEGVRNSSVNRVMEVVRAVLRKAAYEW